MDPLINEYFRSCFEKSSNPHFIDLIALHENQNMSLVECQQLAPSLQRGWFELSHLPSKDRLDFTKEFWRTKMPFNPRFEPFLEKFFEDVEDIGIFLIQLKKSDPYAVQMIYSLKHQKGFFKGNPPLLEKELSSLSAQFPAVVFPKDFIGFAEIHNGFSKASDTGIFPIEQLKERQEKFAALVASKDTLLQFGKQCIDAKELIPFYESFGLPFYQCFWINWYPEDEMGNVYYSSSANTISCLAPNELTPENMAFPTFSDWLIFYLETIEV